MRTGQLIAGEWREAGDADAIDVVNPATGVLHSTVPIATHADLDAALDAAQAAWGQWRDAGAWTRSAVLRRTAQIMSDRAEDIAVRLTQEQGKPLAEARLEVAASIEQFDWFADEARRVYGRIPSARDTSIRYQVRKESIGPVAAFTPWNFPLLLAARKVAPALAAGCPIIVKPASEAPGPVLLMAEALIDAGLPHGAIQVLTGHPAMISEHLLASPIIRKASFTGSVPVGRTIIGLSAQHITNVSMELGGHAPVLVMDDVDPVAVGRLCAAGKFRNAGQVCISPTRFIVHESIADAFADAFAEHTGTLRVGDGLDPATDVGPLVHDGARGRLDALISDAVEKGATVVRGGGALPGEGFYFDPTVLTGVTPDAAIMTQEPFGPVAPIVRFSTPEEALALANSTSFGLAAYVFTTDLAAATDLGERIEAGIVGINTFAVSGAPVPFGGVKESGIGAESGTEAIEAYLTSKTIATAPFALKRNTRTSPSS